MEIQFLDLSNSSITDAGLGSLARFRYLGLNLRNTRISFKGLSQLQHLDELEWLHAGNTRIGFWGRYRLNRKFRGLDLATDPRAQPPDFSSEDYRRWKLMARME